MHTTRIALAMLSWFCGGGAQIVGLDLGFHKCISQWKHHTRHHFLCTHLPPSDGTCLIFAASGLSHKGSSVFPMALGAVLGDTLRLSQSQEPEKGVGVAGKGSFHAEATRPTGGLSCLPRQTQCTVAVGSARQSGLQR